VVSDPGPYEAELDEVNFEAYSVSAEGLQQRRGVAASSEATPRQPGMIGVADPGTSEPRWDCAGPICESDWEIPRRQLERKLESPARYLRPQEIVSRSRRGESETGAGLCTAPRLQASRYGDGPPAYENSRSTAPMEEQHCAGRHPRIGGPRPPPLHSQEDLRDSTLRHVRHEPRRRGQSARLDAPPASDRVAYTGRRRRCET